MSPPPGGSTDPDANNGRRGANSGSGRARVVSRNPAPPPPPRTTPRVLHGGTRTVRPDALDQTTREQDAWEGLYPGWFAGSGTLAEYQRARQQWAAENPEFAAQFPTYFGLIWQDEKQGWTDDRFMQEQDRFAAAVGAGGGGGGRGRGGGGGGGGGGGLSLEQQYDAAYAAVRDQAGTLGLALEEDGLRSIARAAVDNGWNGDQLTDYLTGGIAGGQTGLREGTVQASIDTIKKLAGDQLLHISDDTARQYAARIASQELTLEGVGTLLAGQAKLRYGWAAESIDSGVSVKDVLLPTRDLISQTLGIAPEAIDMMDPKMLGMMTTTDAATGTTRAATADEVTMRARKDPRWAKTGEARTRVGTMAGMMRDLFEGRVS